MDLIAALTERGIPYREHQSKDNEIFICCPFCVENNTTPDTRFRLGINIVTGWMKCFNGGCEKASRDEQYTWQELQRVLDTGKLEAAAMLVKRKQRQLSRLVLPEDFEILTRRNPEYWGKEAYEYIKGRGVPDWQINEMKIGYSICGEFAYRIIFPVEYRGKLNGIVARAFVEDLEPRYRNSVGEKILYGLTDEPRSRDALVVEGVMDYLSVSRASRTFDDCDFDPAASLSTALTERQLEQLAAYERVTLWFDPDTTGLRGTIKDANLLRKAGKKVWVICPFNAKRMDTRDAGEFGVKQVLNKWLARVRWSEDVDQKFKFWMAFLEED